MALSTRSRWGSATYFDSREQSLYQNYATLILHYPHWKPEDLKKMTPRERKYWRELAEYVAKRAEAKMSSHG